MNHGKIFLGQQIERIRNIDQKNNQCKLKIKDEVVRVNKIGENIFNINGKKYKLKGKEMFPI